MNSPSGTERSTESFRIPADLLAADTASVGSVLSSVAGLAVTNTRARAASVTLVQGDEATTLASTDRIATELDETQYATGARVEQRWPQYTPKAVALGVLSSVSLPIPVTNAVSAGLNVYGETDHAFDDHDRRGFDGLVTFAATAIATLERYEASKTLLVQMQTAMQSRAVIDQARGILMAQHRCTAEEAFAILRRTSQHANIKIRDIAQQIVTAATTP
jgi:hypothetical protein